MQPAEFPTKVLDDVGRAAEASVTVVGRLAGGVNAGAVRVRLGGGTDAVLKAVPRTHSRQVDEVVRAQRVIEHMRARGFPTPAWLAVSATASHVWHLMDFIDADPPAQLTESLVEQLMDINDVQAGQGSEDHDHWRYAWQVVTGREATAAGISGYSPAASALVERVLLTCVGLPPPSAAPDMVHADLNPSNVLTRDGVVVAIVDVENAGRGTRATDLITLHWHTFQDPLDGVRGRLWTKVLDLVGWEWTAALAATQILLQLEWRIRLMSSGPVDEVIERGHRVFDELVALR